MNGHWLKHSTVQSECPWHNVQWFLTYFLQQTSLWLPTVWKPIFQYSSLHFLKYSLIRWPRSFSTRINNKTSLLRTANHSSWTLNVKKESDRQNDISYRLRVCEYQLHILINWVNDLPSHSAVFWAKNYLDYPLIHSGCLSLSYTNSCRTLMLCLHDSCLVTSHLLSGLDSFLSQNHRHFKRYDDLY